MIGRKAGGKIKNSFTPISLNFQGQSQFSEDTSLKATPPKVKKESIDVYKKYIETAVVGGFTPKAKDLDIYRKYASLK